MNRILSAVRLRRRASSEAERRKVVSETGFRVEDGEGVGVMGKENSGKTRVPEILSYFPELYVENSTGFIAKGGIGQMICGTVSSYFEDTWSKSMCEMRPSNGSRSVGSYFDLGVGVHLKREWHRLWLVRSFLAFTWESYLEDLMTGEDQFGRDYLGLPSYCTDLEDIGKIPLGEILCIVTGSKLAFSERSLVSVPFSTIQGKMIIKKPLSFNSSLHWKTPPPNSVAKLRIFQDQRMPVRQNTESGGDSLYLSLNVDSPQLLWKNPLFDQITSEFQDLQTLASSVRVLRKDETARYTINGRKSLVIKLLNWYRETQKSISYGGSSVPCRYFVLQEDFRLDFDLEGSQIHVGGPSFEYYITSNDNRKRRLFSGLARMSNGSYSSPMLEAVMRGNKRVVVCMNKELVLYELGILRRHSENSKYANSLGSILTGMDSGKSYFLHLELPSVEDREVQDFRKKEKDKTLLFKHLVQNKRHFESRLQILQDLKSFGYLIISGLSIGTGESTIIENIYIREIGSNPVLLEEFKTRLDCLLGDNLFEVPFVVFELEDLSRGGKSRTFMVSPCIRSYNELQLYSHFGWLNGESVKRKRFRVYPNGAYSERIFGDIRQSLRHDKEGERLQMGMSHYSKGVSLLVELGDFNFYLDEGILDDLRDNRSIYSLESEFEWLSKSPEGGLSLYLHIIRTCLYILYESYGGGAFPDAVNATCVQKWNSSMRFPKLRELLASETKRRTSSVYFSIIGQLAQMLLEIHLEGEVSESQVGKLLDKVKESMRHASFQVILLDYLVTWILASISTFKVCGKDLPLNVGGSLQNILVYHRLCRQFLQTRKNQAQTQKEVSCGEFTFTGIMNSTLPVEILGIKEEDKGKEAFFRYLMRFYTFEKMSQLLVNPIDIENQVGEKMSYFNLLKDEPTLDLLSIGRNKSGILGLGPPRVKLFSDLECNLCPELAKVNRSYSLDGIEDERSKCIQKVVVPDGSFLVKGISSIAYGTDHIVILGKEGDILTWGSNSSGQCSMEKKSVNRTSIGLGFDNDFRDLVKRVEDHENLVSYPSRISCFSSIHGRIKVNRVECGACFTLALDSNGDLFSWGQGKDGCLGTGSYEDSFVPKKINFGSRIKSFSAGMFHSAAIDVEHQLFVWGSNEFGQLGTKLYMDDESLSVPLKISVKISRKDERSSKLTITGFYGDLDEQDLEGLVKWKGVSLGEAHSVALDTDGLVWVWGQNDLKQLTGIPEMLETEVVLSRGRISSDYYKKLGSQVIFPTPLVSTEKTVVFASRKINMIFSGSTACCAIDEQGKPWIWGLSFTGIDHHNSVSIFSRKQGSKANSHTDLREFELPVRVFRNITPDDDSIRVVRFGKGNNNISMISRLGRCYLWLENRDLVTEQMRYSNTHNCFILEDLQGVSLRDNKSNRSSWYYSILDVALLSDSIVFVSKKASKSQNR